MVDESLFKSKLPEVAQSHEPDPSTMHGKMQVRVFDGNFCQTRDEALAKFRERQVKEAVSQADGHFFTNRTKRIKRVENTEGGVMNLIMRQPSGMQTTGSRQSGRSSAQEDMSVVNYPSRDPHNVGVFQAQKNNILEQSINTEYDPEDDAPGI